jgi:crotonobetainyl-CoA:carnitine CoA-transferase CaiB-like acyl-CoA transferase
MEIKGEKGGLLQDIQILDLTDEKASLCTKLLSDLGARVIKVERPGGDSSRKIGPFLGNLPHPERSLFFYYNNTNKLGITLNIENSSGREIFSRLIKRADVVVETFPPGYLKELGLGFEILSELNPKLILVSVTGFGQGGPRCQYKSCDIVASAFGGQMYVSGSPSTPPLKPFGEQSYYTASLFAAIGILLALRKRNLSGKGEHIDISLQEAVVSTLDHIMVRYFYEQVISKRQGNLYWNYSFSVLACKDGHILITPFQQWDTLIEWMDSEGMAEDLKNEKFKEEEYRLRQFEHIIEVLERWTKNHTMKELFELGQLMRFPWAPIYSPTEVLDNPHLKARKFFIDLDHQEIGTSLKYPGIPYQFSSSSFNRLERPPSVGEDNIQIFQDELGLSEEELQRLSSIGAI